MNRKNCSLFGALTAMLLSGVWLSLHARAEQPQTEEQVELNWATEQARAARDRHRRQMAEQLASLEREFQQLSTELGGDHPRLREIEAQIDAIRAASQREQQRDQRRWNARPNEAWIAEGQYDRRVNPAGGPDAAESDRQDQVDQQRQQQMQHAREAIEHLRAAQMPDLADMVDQQVRRRLERDSLSQGEPSRYGPQNDLRRMIERLGQAVENIEQRVRESEEVRRAVEDVQRHVGHLQREVELRLREMEQHVNHHAQNAEQVMGERSRQVEEAIGNVERHVEESIGAIEEQLRELYERSEANDESRDEDD